MYICVFRGEVCEDLLYAWWKKLDQTVNEDTSLDTSGGRIVHHDHSFNHVCVACYRSMQVYDINDGVECVYVCVSIQYINIFRFAHFSLQ